MHFEIVELDCNIYGSFKVGDNAIYNAQVLSNLVEENTNSAFNKPIILQVASLVEVATIQIFYRAKHYNREGVPNIAEEDRQNIEDKRIDKFAVVIDNLRRYDILRGLNSTIYDDLHKLRKYRNKIHIQSNIEIEGVSRDERRQFSDVLTRWAIDLNWKVHSYLEENYARPTAIRGNVEPLRLPRLIQ